MHLSVDFVPIALPHRLRSERTQKINYCCRDVVVRIMTAVGDFLGAFGWRRGAEYLVTPILLAVWSQQQHHQRLQVWRLGY
jgi:hypothetical protein